MTRGQASAGAALNSMDGSVWFVVQIGGGLFVCSKPEGVVLEMWHDCLRVRVVDTDALALAIAIDTLNADCLEIGAGKLADLKEKAARVLALLPSTGGLAA